MLQRELEQRDHLEDLSIDGRIILEGILEKQGRKVWTRHDVSG